MTPSSYRSDSLEEHYQLQLRQQQEEAGAWRTSLTIDCNAKVDSAADKNRAMECQLQAVTSQLDGLRSELSAEYDRVRTEHRARRMRHERVLTALRSTPHSCVCVCMHVCMFACACASACMCMCMCKLTYAVYVTSQAAQVSSRELRDHLAAAEQRATHADGKAKQQARELLLVSARCDELRAEAEHATELRSEASESATLPAFYESALKNPS